MAKFDIDTVKIRDCSVEFEKQVDIAENSFKNIRLLLLDINKIGSGKDFDDYISIISQDKEYAPYASIVDCLKQLSLSFSKIDDDAKKIMKDNVL